MRMLNQACFEQSARFNALGMAVEVPETAVKALLKRLESPHSSLSEKYRALFSLRNLAGSASHAALLQGLKDDSALFRHEVAYCLGQRRDPAAVKTLSSIMNNIAEHPMVRHEAGEALGAIGCTDCMAELRRHQNDSCLEVAQTCQLAVQRIDFYNSAEGQQYQDESKYLSVDPAPAYPTSKPLTQLRACLLDESAEIFSRYRALFALRNLGSSEAIQALGAAFAGRSALLKHEVAYVLGQLQDKHAVDTLRQVLTDSSEDAMVRHEAAEALGAIADLTSIDLLKQHIQDPEPIVADSCIVALDMLDHELSNDFQYASGVCSNPSPDEVLDTAPQEQPV